MSGEINIFSDCKYELFHIFLDLWSVADQNS